jgi:hypothetical protein
MAIEKKDPGAGRPSRGLPAVPPSAAVVPPSARPPVRPPLRPTARPASRPASRPPGRAVHPARHLLDRLAGAFAGLAAGAPSQRQLSLLRWPALLTLAVTLLRFAGEVLRWSPEYFSRLPGGGLSPLGITWLAPFVGFYLGWRLERAGVRSPSPAVAFGAPAGALVAGALAASLGGRLLKTSWTSNFTLWAIVSVGVAAAVLAAWPLLGRLLLAYAWAARVPVVLLMAVAIWKNLGTHYDLVPPGFPPMPPLRRWLVTSVLPQMTIWVAWTMATGAIGGALGWSAARRREQ